MSLTRINTNISALQSLDALNRINTELMVRNLRLATGKKINSAGDDPAGYEIATRLKARIIGLTRAVQNVADGKSALTVAEGGMTSVMDLLLTMKDKVTQAASDILGTAERTAIENELDELAAEVTDISEQTEFNGVKMLDGTYTSKVIQTGEKSGDTITIGISQNFSATTLSVADSDLDVTSSSFAGAALSNVNSAIDTVAAQQSSLGATISRMTSKEGMLTISITNSEAAKSRILDADLAREQLESVKLQILQQMAAAALVQANLSPQIVLNLTA